MNDEWVRHTHIIVLFPSQSPPPPSILSFLHLLSQLVLLFKEERFWFLDVTKTRIFKNKVISHFMHDSDQQTHFSWIFSTNQTFISFYFHVLRQKYQYNVMPCTTRTRGNSYCCCYYNRCPLIWMLVIRIGLALQINSLLIPQNYNLAWNYWLLDQVQYSVMASRIQIICGQKVQIQIHFANGNSRTSNCQCSLFSKKNPIIQILHVWMAHPN